MDNYRGGRQGDRGQGRDRDDVIRVENARIESISIDNNTGNVRISYSVPGERNRHQSQTVVLIVSRDTIIQDQFGQRLSMRDLREGMHIDAEFSSVMTRSIPPQARAFRIIVRNRKDGSSNIKLGMIINVDVANRFFVTGSPNNLRNQMRFSVSNSTVILDRRGNRIDLRNLQPAMMVRVEHADFQTASIPPQTTAFRVQVL